MNELALFAGAGGGLLGSHLLGWRPICAVESEPYCREILLRRQRNGLLPLFPIWDDVRTFNGTAWRGFVDVITAGFPCQPWSVAGRKKQEGDPRNMWPDTIRIIREMGPQFALLENVPGLLRSDYFGQILGDLDESGFDAEWGVLSAAGSGAPHRRKRLWIIAHSSKHRNEARPIQKTNKASMECESLRNGQEESMADAKRQRLAVGEKQELLEQRTPTIGDSGWTVESSVGRVAHGVAHRVDQLRALGNGQVPAVVRRAWEALMKRGRV